MPLSELKKWRKDEIVTSVNYERDSKIQFDKPWQTFELKAAGTRNKNHSKTKFISLGEQRILSEKRKAKSWSRQTTTKIPATGNIYYNRIEQTVQK